MEKSTNFSKSLQNNAKFMIFCKNSYKISQIFCSLLTAHKIASLIVSQVLDFNSNNDAPIFLICGHPQVKDTNSMQYCLDNDATMVDVPKGSSIA